MTAVQTFGTLRVLAVDATRLDRVMSLPPRDGDRGAGPDWATIARALRPDVPDAVHITGRELRLAATWIPAADPTRNSPARPHRRQVRRRQRLADHGDAGPTASRPARLYRHRVGLWAGGAMPAVSLALAGTPAADGSESVPPPPGSTLMLHSLRQLGPDSVVVS